MTYRSYVKFYSRLISLFSSRFNLLNKKAINHIVLPRPKRSASHPHPVAARNRTTVEGAIDTFITTEGFLPYSISRSSRDAGDGTRLFYFNKDLIDQFRDDPLGSKHFIKIVDADYYCDMNEVLGTGHPVLIYTFVPITAGGPVPDGHFSITNNEITYQLGATVYKHYVWDYCRDTVTVRASKGGVFVYELSQLVLPDDASRRIIMFLPRAYISSVASMFVELQPLERRQFTKDGVNVVVDLHKRVYSLSEEGSFTSVSVSFELLEAISVRLSTSRSPNIGEVERYLRIEGGQQPLSASITAAILFKLWSRKHSGSKVEYAPLVKVGECVPHYYALADDPSYDPDKYCRKLGPRVTTSDSPVPAVGPSNDALCVQERVNEVQNIVVPKNVYLKFAAEFIELVVPVPGIGAPCSIDDVRAVQDSPLQRSRFKVVETWLFSGKMLVKSFQKKECYPKIGAPRNISTVPCDHTTRLSCFTMSFKETNLVPHPWYQPCLTPTEIAENVSDFCSRHNVVNETDYSKFDGTISEFLRRTVEHACYLRWVAEDYQNELASCLESELNPNAITKTGIWYDPGCSRLSGSPCTTDGNCLVNAFVAYCAGRLTRLSPTEAFSSIGLVYGDDGISSIPAKAIETAATELGLKIKCNTRYIARGDDVSFLGRIFPQPSTSIYSYQDPNRTIVKLHQTCSNTNIPIRDAGIHRARGYLVTDAKTPIISNWCNMMLRILKDDGRPVNPNLVYSYGHGPWPQGEDPSFFVESMCARLNITSARLDEICQAIDAHNDLNLDLDLLEVDIPCDYSVVVGDEVRIVPTYRDQLEKLTALKLAQDRKQFEMQKAAKAKEMEELAQKDKGKFEVDVREVPTKHRRTLSPESRGSSSSSRVPRH